MFIRARVTDANGHVKEEDRASETLEVIIDHLAATSTASSTFWKQVMRRRCWKNREAET